MFKSGSFGDEIFENLVSFQVDKMQALHESFFGKCRKCPLYSACSEMEKRMNVEEKSDE